MSSWTDFTDSLANLGTAGVNAYKTYTANGAPAPGVPAPTPPAPGSGPNWTVIGLVLAGVLLVAVVFVGFGKK